MGITLREIIFDIGGGILVNKKFKAVQSGGPSGDCIPEKYLDLSVDFDSLNKVGTYQMLQILEKITSGKGEPGDIEKLEGLGNNIKASSLYGLEQTAPNPILTTIKYFREEYEEHIKYCIAKVCNIGMLKIEQEECILCGLCKQACAFDTVKETRRSFLLICITAQDVKPPIMPVLLVW